MGKLITFVTMFKRLIIYLAHVGRLENNTVAICARDPEQGRKSEPQNSGHDVSPRIGLDEL
jgi:hypothetical protein